MSSNLFDRSLMSVHGNLSPSDSKKVLCLAVRRRLNLFFLLVIHRIFLFSSFSLPSSIIHSFYYFIIFQTNTVYLKIGRMKLYLTKECPSELWVFKLLISFCFLVILIKAQAQSYLQQRKT